MRRICILFFSALSVAAFSQPTFNKTYLNGILAEAPAWGQSLIQLQSGELIGMGHLMDCPGCAYHQRVYKLLFDQTGIVINWELLGNLDTTYVLNNLVPGAVFTDNEQRIVFSVGQQTTGASSMISRILRLDPSGEMSDTLKTFPYGQGFLPESDWKTFSIINGKQNEDGSYVFCGNRTDILTETNNTPPKIAFMKLDSVGQVLWQRSYPNSFLAYSVSPATNGGYWLIGSNIYFVLNPFGVWNENQTLILKTDSEGNEQFRHEFGGYGYEGYTFCHEEPDRLIVAGYQTYDEPYTSSLNDDQGYMFIRSYTVTDSSLSLVQETILYQMEGVGSDWTYLQPLGFKLCNSNSGYFIHGKGILPQPNLKADAFLMKINSELETEWLRRYTHPSHQEPINWHVINDMQEKEDGSLYLFGDIKGSGLDDPPFVNRLWLLHVDEHGCLEPGCHLVGTEEIITHMTETMRVYPNPARDVCTIAFSLREGYTAPAQSQLKLTDMQGRIVRTIALSGAKVASGTVQVELSGLALGVYVAHWMDGGRWMDSVKIVVE